MNDEEAIYAYPEVKVSDEYHKSRKNLVLVAGFLLAVTLIGIEPEMDRPAPDVGEETVASSEDVTDAPPVEDVTDAPPDSEASPDEPSEEAQANPPAAVDDGPTVSQPFCGEFLGFPVCIRNPSVAPFVLLLLILYFGARFGIETSMARGIRPPHKVLWTDVGLAWTIAAAAVAVYLAQVAAGFDVGAVVATNKISAVLTIAVATCSLVLSAWQVFRRRRGHFGAEMEARKDEG